MISQFTSQPDPSNGYSGADTRPTVTPPNGRGSNNAPNPQRTRTPTNSDIRQPPPSHVTHSTDRDTRGTVEVVPGRGSIARTRIPTRNAWNKAPSYAVLTDIYDLVDELTSWTGSETARGIAMPEETIFRFVVAEMFRDTPSTKKWWVGANTLHSASAGIAAPGSAQAEILDSEMLFQNVTTHAQLDWSHCMMEATSTLERNFGALPATVESDLLNNIRFRKTMPGVVDDGITQETPMAYIGRFTSGLTRLRRAIATHGANGLQSNSALSDTACQLRCCTELDAYLGFREGTGTDTQRRHMDHTFNILQSSTDALTWPELSRMLNVVWQHKTATLSTIQNLRNNAQLYAPDLLVKESPHPPPTPEPTAKRSRPTPNPTQQPPRTALPPPGDGLYNLCFRHPVGRHTNRECHNHITLDDIQLANALKLRTQTGAQTNNIDLAEDMDTTPPQVNNAGQTQQTTTQFRNRNVVEHQALRNTPPSHPPPPAGAPPPHDLTTRQGLSDYTTAAPLAVIANDAPDPPAVGG